MEEGADVMEEDFEGSLMDAALIGAAQRVEHYEIAAYGTVCAFAQELGETEQASLLTRRSKKKKKRMKSSPNSLGRLIHSKCQSNTWLTD